MKNLYIKICSLKKARSLDNSIVGVNGPEKVGFTRKFDPLKNLWMIPVSRMRKVLHTAVPHECTRNMKQPFLTFTESLIKFFDWFLSWLSDSWVEGEYVWLSSRQVRLYWFDWLLDIDDELLTTDYWFYRGLFQLTKHKSSMESQSIFYLNDINIWWRILTINQSCMENEFFSPIV